METLAEKQSQLIPSSLVSLSLLDEWKSYPKTKAVFMLVLVGLLGISDVVAVDKLLIGTSWCVERVDVCIVDNDVPSSFLYLPVKLV